MEYRSAQFVGRALVMLVLFPALLSAAPADDRYTVAAGHYARSQWQLAIDEFRALLADHPDHSRANASRFYLGEALVQLGKFDEAHAAFEEFFNRSPDDPRNKQALFRLGETSYLAGRSEAAKSELSRFAERYPDDKLNAYVGAFLGDLAIGSQDWESARAHYQQSLQQYPDGPLATDARYGLARALENLNEAGQAEAMFAEVASRNAGGVSADAQYRLGSNQYARGDYAAAAQTLHAFAGAFPQHPLNRQARMAEGWARYRLQDYARAEQIFAEQAALPDATLEARYWLGLAQKVQGNWSAAAQTLGNAADSAGDSELAAPLLFHAAEAQLRAGNAKQADALFARLITDFPQSEWADDCWLGRARAALAAANYPLVDHHAAHFAEHCPDSDKRWPMERVRADSLIARKQYAEAARLLETLAGDDPDPRAAGSHQAALAVAYLGAGEASDALVLLETLPAETAPDVIRESQLTRAHALVTLGRFTEAMLIVESLCSQEQDRARLSVCRAQLAICCARTGNLPRAKTLFQQFTAAGPDAELLGATTTYLAEAAREAGDTTWSDELLASATAGRIPVSYAAKALARRGWDEFQRGKFEAAAATLERLIEQFPSQPETAQAALTRAKALTQLDRTADALESYQWIVDQHPESTAAPKALLAGARLHDQLQQDEQAAAWYQRLAKEHPKLGERDAVLYEWAWVLADLQQGEQSQQLFEQLRAEFPRSKLAADATFRLAQQARQRGALDDAARLLDETVSAASDPELTQHALYAQGQLAAARNAWADVALPLERLKREFPGSPLVLMADYWLAEATYRQQQYDLAEERFAKLAESTAGRTDSWVAQCALRRAQLAAHRAEWQRAQELAARIAADFPAFEQQYEADYILGRALAGQLQYDEARQAYRRVVDSPSGGKTETAAMAQWMIGESFLNQKEYQTALKEFLRLEILYAYPTWQAGALLQAGKCQEMLGKSREATALYARVAKDYPETEFAAEARTRLKAVGAAEARRLNRGTPSAKGVRH